MGMGDSGGNIGKTGGSAINAVNNGGFYNTGEGDLRMHIS